MRAWMVATVLAAMATGAAAQSVKDGVDAWQRSDYDAAVRAWRPLAAAGDGDAAFDLAQAYKLGRGVAPDMTQARTFYGQAARAGHLQGEANYGLLLFQDGDRKGAMPWIIKASDAGDPRAQYVYGTALYNGDLAPKNLARAYALMTRAAAAGLPQATTSLAQMDRFIPVGDRQAGQRLAATLAAQPVPPLGRALITGGTPAPRLAPMQVAAAIPASGAPPRPAPQRAPAVAAAASARIAPARPAPTPAAHAALPGKAGGAWQVQLGAYGSEASAKAQWASLTGKAPALRPLTPRYEKAGAVVRLRAAGLFDRAAAEHACSAASAAGAGCFPVAP